MDNSRLLINGRSSFFSTQGVFNVNKLIKEESVLLTFGKVSLIVFFLYVKREV